MANALRRYIKPDEVVILDGKHSGVKFICKAGPGLNPKARLSHITGTYPLSGQAGTISGFWIDAEATNKALRAEVEKEIAELRKQAGSKLQV